LKGGERRGGVEEDGRPLIDNEEYYRIFKDVVGSTYTQRGLAA
jgi:hypothetical protein